MPDSQNRRPPNPVRFLTVGDDSSGQRLDNYLTRELKGVPRTRLYRALRKGEVRVNKGRVKADSRLVPCVLARSPPRRQPAPSDPPTIPRVWSRQLARQVVMEGVVL